MAEGARDCAGCRLASGCAARILFGDGTRVETTPGDRDRPDQDRRFPLPGVVLSWKWKGRTVLVEVLAKGFRYDNRYYLSLSAVAVAVPGTRWNGLAYFGLTKKADALQSELTHAD